MKKLLQGLIHLNYLLFKKPFIRHDPNRICIGNNNQLPSQVKNIKYSIRGNNNTISIHPSCKIDELKITIFGNNNTCIIGPNGYLHQVSVWFEDDFGSITIKNNSTFEQVLLACVENNTSISIGEDCMFSNGIELRTSDSHSIIDMNDNIRTNPAKSISIGNHVWVGGHAKILKGASLGDHSIVAMGSIVSKSFGSHVMVGGVPAKILKTQVTWSRERI